MQTKTLYLAEVYVNGPNGEPGWEIEFYWLTARCSADARGRLSMEVAKLYSVIQITEQSERFALAGCEAIDLG